MKYSCPSCAGHVEIDSYTNQALTCPHCQQAVQFVPMQGQPPVIPRPPAQPVQAAPAKLSGYVCALCGSAGSPKYRYRGSILIEIILWCFFLIPGLIYSVWRQTSKEKVCRKCGSPSMIPANSPRGRQFATAA